MTGDGMPQTSAPTEQQVYQLYENVLDDLNRICNNTMDKDVIDTVCPVAQSLSDWLTEVNELDLEANTALFQKLTPAMKTANLQLKVLKQQLAGIADKIDDIGKVLEGLTKVLELAEKFT